MKILEFLPREAVNVDLKSASKNDVLAELMAPLEKMGVVEDSVKMVEVLLEREELGSTGIGHQIAIPHGKSAMVSKLTASFGLSRKGIAYDALDGEKVHVLFALVAPPGAAGLHLRALAKISGLLKDGRYRKLLMAATSAAEVIAIIENEEQAAAG